MLSLAATHATNSAIQAVDLAFRAAGSASIYTNTRLERCLRDARTAGHHIAAALPNYELVGQALLGLDMAHNVVDAGGRAIRALTVSPSSW